MARRRQRKEKRENGDKDRPEASRRRISHQQESFAAASAGIRDRQESSAAASIAIDITRDKDDDALAFQETESTSVNMNNPEDENVFACKECAEKEDRITKVREEFECGVCLDLCFEPCTTGCGHLFCKSCLERALAKCGMRCPKCRQDLGYSRDDFKINTSLWNSIKIIFPEATAQRQIDMDKEEADWRRMVQCFTCDCCGRVRPEP